MNEELSKSIRSLIIRGICAVAYLPAHPIFFLEWLIDGKSDTKDSMKYYIINGESRPYYY
jgi:hypothetical protein